jgi:tetratricopeptide (TPR) repeat protein
MGRFRRALELEPSFWPAHWMVGRALEATGESAAAKVELEKAIELSAGNPQTIAALGHLCARSGDRAGAQSALDRLAAMARERYVAAFDFAIVYAGLDATDDALTWLERAYAERSIVSGGSLSTDPRLRPLRTLKPYRELLRRVGVELTETSISQAGDSSIGPVKA